MPSTLRWRGDAPAVAQVDSITPANVEIADVFTVTMNGKTISVVATAATVANVTALLTAAWNASTIPEFAEVTATDATTKVTLTADKAGRPFTVTASAVDGGGSDTQTLTRAGVTTSSGPNDLNIAANYSTGSLPTNSDTLVVDSGSDILYNLGSLSGVTLTELRVDRTYSGKIGLPYINQDGSTSYIEYRQAYLAIGATTINIGLGTGIGSGRIKINTGSVQTTLNVFDTGSQLESGIGSVVWKGTHASSAVNMLTQTSGGGASLSIAPFAGESATVLAMNVQAAATVYCGSGCTFTNLTFVQADGTVTLNSATTGTATLTVYGGTLTLQSGGHLGLTVRGGTVIYNSTGTLGGAPVVSGSGVLDFSQDLRAKTVTNPIDIYGDKAQVLDPSKVVGTLVVDLDEGSKAQNIDFGTNVRLTRGTPS